MCYWGGGTIECVNNGFSLGRGGEIWEDYEFEIGLSIMGLAGF